MHRPRGTLAARTIGKSYGETVVLDGLSLSVTPSSRIGVVGPNGIGKSTLLRLLAGVEEPDSGAVTREPPDLSVAYLVQERAVEGLSGGEAARRNLEAILAADADVLLLDEPTNDLDFAGLELLERFLASHRGGVVAVSHDRAFLERMTSIVELEAETRRVRVYAGGWSEFVAQREAARERHESAYAGYVSERERLEEQARRMRQWEERGYGQGRKKKKSKDVKKAAAKKLGRLERVEKPWTPWQLRLSLAPASRGGDVVARLSGAVVERDGFRVGPVDLELRHGDRLALLGRNGAGKTTLLQALLGELPLAVGRAPPRPGHRARRAAAGRRPVRGRGAPARPLRRRERARGRRGALAARDLRARRRRRAPPRPLALARRAQPCRDRAAGGARRERARPRRADEQPRPRGDRAARARARRATRARPCSSATTAASSTPSARRRRSSSSRRAARGASRSP